MRGKLSGRLSYIGQRKTPLLSAPAWALERHPSRHNEIVIGDGICRHRHLIADPDDEVVALRSPGDWKTAEYDTRSEQHLAEVLMHSVREVLVVDLEFRPEILEDVILKGDVGEDWITKRGDSVDGGIDRGHRILLADGRLNVEIAPAFTERQGRLQDVQAVGDIVDPRWEQTSGESR